MIPKIAHFYWGGTTLPFLRFLTVWSFAKQNPGWKVRFYYPRMVSLDKPWPTHEQKYAITGRDYYHWLRELPIEFIALDHDDFCGKAHQWSEVHKSDLLRWRILSTTGGLWSDMDIVYFRPFNFNLTGATYLCHNYVYGHSVGFILSCPDNLFFGKVFEEAERCIDPTQYQSIGATLLNTKFSQPFSDYSYVNMPMDLVYAYDALHIPEVYAPVIDGASTKFTENSIGLHWYAGHPLSGAYQNSVDHTNYDNVKNFIGIVVREACYRGGMDAYLCAHQAIA